MVIVIGYLLLFAFYSMLNTGVKRRQGTAVVHSCQNHVNRQWLASLAVT